MGNGFSFACVFGTITGIKETTLYRNESVIVVTEFFYQPLNKFEISVENPLL